MESADALRGAAADVVGVVLKLFGEPVHARGNVVDAGGASAAADGNVVGCVLRQHNGVAQLPEQARVVRRHDHAEDLASGGRERGE